MDFAPIQLHSPRSMIGPLPIDGIFHGLYDADMKGVGGNII